MPSNWSTFKGNFWGYGQPLPAYTGENIAIFMGGLDVNGGNINNTSIYSYTTNIALEGAALTYMANSAGAVSNGNMAVYAGGEYRPDTNDSLSYYLSTSTNYTYSNNTVVSGSNLPFTMGYIAATGNNVVGIFGWSGPNSSNSSIYTFSSNTYIAGANLTYGNSGAAATGNADIAMFGGGGTGALTQSNVYVYSDNVFLAASSLLYVSQNIAAAGTPYVGVFTSGSWVNSIATLSSLTSQYTYSNLSVVGGGNLANESEWLGAASNSTTGVFGGGSGSQNNTSLYTFSNNSSAIGGTLSHGSYALCATGPNPGINCGTIINQAPAPTTVWLTSNSGQWVVPNGVYVIDVTVVAGSGGGGGGATDYQYVDQSGYNGYPGENTVFGDIVATGGIAGVGMSLYGIPGEGGGYVGGTGTPGGNGQVITTRIGVIPGQIVPYSVGNGGNGGQGKAYSGAGTGAGVGGTNGGSGTAAPAAPPLSGGYGGTGFTASGGAYSRGGSPGNFGNLSIVNGSGGGGGGAGGISISY